MIDHLWCAMVITFCMHTPGAVDHFQRLHSDSLFCTRISLSLFPHITFHIHRHLRIDNVHTWGGLLSFTFIHPLLFACKYLHVFTFILHCRLIDWILPLSHVTLTAPELLGISSGLFGDSILSRVGHFRSLQTIRRLYGQSARASAAHVCFCIPHSLPSALHLLLPSLHTNTHSTLWAHPKHDVPERIIGGIWPRL